MNVSSFFRDKARSKKRRVVLPEGTELRTIQAAKKIISDSIANVTLLGDPNKIAALAKDYGLNLTKIEVIDPPAAANYDTFVSDFIALRKHKGITEQDARTAIANPLYYGAMMVHKDIADASVAGAVNTTGDVLRAAIQTIGMKPGMLTLSSSFIMTLPRFREELNKILLFADCAVVPNPTAEQLVSIASATADTMQNLLGMTPKVAFLSFSTKGSAAHPDVEKVTKALELFHKDRPDIQADGELQLDAALIPEIGKRKAPQSEIAGQANILIFPDLDAGNIGYKMAERLGGATATGPVIQGLAKPANDLSRGCSADDIVDTSAIALLLKG